MKDPTVGKETRGREEVRCRGVRRSQPPSQIERVSEKPTQRGALPDVGRREAAVSEQTEYDIRAYDRGRADPMWQYIDLRDPFEPEQKVVVQYGLSGGSPA